MKEVEWVGHVSSVRKWKTRVKFSSSILEGQGHLEYLGVDEKDNIKIDVKEIGW
jgi:hypothetical protein